MKKGSGVQMKPSGIGGMAVMEGVMIKNKDAYAVAVRKFNNEIVVEKSTHRDFSDKVKLFKLPIFRGMLVFVDSLVVGMKGLNYSTGFIEKEEEHKREEKKKQKLDKKNNRKKKEQTKSKGLYINTNTGQTGSWIADENTMGKGKTNPIVMTIVVILSIAMSIGLFMVLPVLVSNYFEKFITNKYFFVILEGILRLIIFIGYITVVSQMTEIKRIFMYHGAEHKVINCLEHGYDLTAENVKIQSRQFKLCNTSFMLLVILVSLILFIFLPSQTLSMRILSRVLLLPAVSGVLYEFICLSGKSNNSIANIISAPGLLIQGFITREPDQKMIEVAMKSVEAVFDWQTFLAAGEVTGKKKKGNKNTVNLHPVNVNYSKSEKPAMKKPDGKSKPVNLDLIEEEDDEILRALDKYIS
jgi:uncharacterized protein YqhQ